MNLFERLTSWIGLDHQTSRQDFNPLRDLLEQGKQHRRAEQYDEALYAYNQAATLARMTNHDTVLTAIELSRVEIMTRRGDWIEARELLRQLENLTTGPHIAYVKGALGVLAQAQEQWDEARRYYEEARELAAQHGAVGAEGRALGHLADTYMQESNASYAVHLLKEALVKLDESGDIELSSYFVGRLGQALVATGQDTEGLDLIGRALRMAEDMEFQEYVRRWRLVLAIEAARLGRYPQVKRNLLAALPLFEHIETTPEYITLLCRLSKTCLRLHDGEDALGYARRAVEFATPFGTVSAPYLQAMGALGVALTSMERFAEAVPALETATSARVIDQTLTDADYNRIELLRHLAAARAETGNFASAEETYQRALALAETVDAPLDTAGTYRDLGTLYARRGDSNEAIQCWTKALERYEQHDDYARVARLHVDIANVRRQTGLIRRAMKDYERALTAINLAGDSETRGIVLAHAATAYVDQGDVATARAFFEESIKIAAQVNDRRAEATRRGNYGWFLLTTGHAHDALTTLAVAVRQSQAENLPLQAAVQTDNIGLAYDELQDHEQALVKHQRALEMLSALNAPEWVAVVRANLAHTLVSMGRLFDAEPHFQRSLELGRELKSDEVIARALNGLIRIALKRGKLDRVEAMVDESVNAARKTGMRRLLSDSLALQSRFFAATGRHESAVDAWDEARRLLELLGVPAEELPEWLREPMP